MIDAQACRKRQILHHSTSRAYAPNMKRRIPSLNWLRVFEAAARTESFARAAERLNMSAAAVSQQIKSLESYVGRPLFNRGAHQVTLTDAGRAFWPTVSEALNTVEIRAATLFGTTDTTPLTVRATQILACSWLASRLPDFHRENPDVTVHLISDAASANEAGEDVELRIIFGDGHTGWAERDRLFGESLYPVALPDVCATLETAEDFHKHRLIEIADHRSGWFSLFDAVNVGFDDAQFSVTDRTDLALALAASGYGIALARAPATDVIVKRYGLQRCLENVEVLGIDSYYLTYRSKERLSSAGVRFRDWLLEAAIKHE